MVNKQLYKDYSLVIFLFLFMGVLFLINCFQESGMNDPLSFIKNNPSNLIFLVVPILFLFFIMIKGYSKKDFFDFMKFRFMKLLGRFMGFIITTFAAYFILFPYKFNDIWDNLLYLFILLTVFILFSFSWKFEEDEIPPLSRKRAIKLGKFLLRTFLIIFIPFIILFWVIYPFTNLKIAVFSSFIYNFLIISGASPVNKGKLRIIFNFIGIIIVQLIMFYLATHFIPGLNTVNMIGWIIAGTILFGLSMIISHILKENKYFIAFRKDFYRYE
ncbi:MAG: hypothetical protein WC438_00075 [Candidatus Pacearchaeota archaeon]